MRAEIPNIHLRTETALNLIGGRLNADQEKFWDEQLESCCDCLQELAWRQLGEDRTRFCTESAPGRDLKEAILFSSDHAQAEHLSLRLVPAEVIFDSFGEPSGAAVRGDAGTARQLIIRAGEIDIHIKIWREREERQLLGQLLPRSGGHFVCIGRCHLLRNGDKLETTAIDDLGEFRFMHVPDEDLSLQIDLPNLTVIIGSLNVRAGSVISD
jgi:hypothetical protein